MGLRRLLGLRSATHCTLADLKMERFLTRADDLGTCPTRPRRRAPSMPTQPRRRHRTPDRLCLSIDLAARRDHHNHLGHRLSSRPLVARSPRPATAPDDCDHQGGVVTDAPGLYALGLPLLRTRASTYIHGAAADTAATRRPPRRAISAASSTRPARVAPAGEQARPARPRPAGS